MTLLVVTAVPAEREAILAAGCSADVLVCGVGPVAAAAATAAALTTGSYSAVASAGIAGGFPPAAVGEVVVAERVIFADLGVEGPDGPAPLDIAVDSYPADPLLRDAAAARAGTPPGEILTVTTVTATAASAARLAARYPDAVAEAMEGFGVAEAAARADVPFVEVRAISNLVGPRDVSLWRIADALAALGRVIAALAEDPVL